MHCREFESRLNDILDDRGQPRADDQLVAHAQHCDSCRQLLAGQQALFTGLKHRPLSPSVSAGFAERTVAQATPVVVARGASPSRVWWALATVLSTAAAVLLIVSVVWQARRGNAPRPENNIVDNEPSVPTPNHPKRNAPRSGLAMSQADWLLEAPRLPATIRGSYRGTIDNLAVALPETVQRLDEVEHYAPGIRPIRISFGLMLDALWRTIPGSREDVPPTRTSYQAFDWHQVV